MVAAASPHRPILATVVSRIRDSGGQRNAAPGCVGGRSAEPQIDAMAPSAGGRRMAVVTIPIVTELPQVLEPVTVDTFAGGKPIVPAPPIRRLIVD